MGSARDIELLIGHNRDEYNWAIGGDVITPDDAGRALQLLAPDGHAYRTAYPDADHRELHELVCSDFVYRMPTLHMEQAHAAAGGTTFLYEFCYGASPIGAAHTTEIPLVFRTLESPVGKALYGTSPETDSVSREMSDAWRSFAMTGDPGWPAYSAGQQLTRVFDTESRTTRYPEQASQQIWAGYPFDPFTLQR
jgi:para-nitrobenzyl esterase